MLPALALINSKEMSLKDKCAEIFWTQQKMKSLWNISLLNFHHRLQSSCCCCVNPWKFYWSDTCKSLVLNRKHEIMSCHALGFLIQVEVWLVQPNVAKVVPSPFIFLLVSCFFKILSTVITGLVVYDSHILGMSHLKLHLHFHELGWGNLTSSS